MMACSIVVQGASLAVLRNRMTWQGSLAFVAGGVLGIPPALYLLQRAETGIFRVGFGVFLAAYAAYSFFVPPLHSCGRRKAGAGMRWSGSRAVSSEA